VVLVEIFLKQVLVIIKVLCFATDPMNLVLFEKLMEMDQCLSTQELTLKQELVGIHVRNHLFEDLERKKLTLFYKGIENS
jgi:hypothetical protein